MNSNGGEFWSRGWFWCLLAVLSTAPFVIAPLPMMTDYFSHTGRYHIMNHGEESPWLRQYYDFRWTLIGNLGVDLLMVPLGRILPTETAATIIAATIPPLTIAGIFAVGKAVWGRIEAPALLALSFVYSYSFVYGFVNYHLAVALAMLVFALWIRMTVRNAVVHWLLFTPLALLVWLSHVAGWAVLLLLIGCWELVTAHRRGGGVAKTIAQAALRSLPIAVPILLTLFWRNAAAGGALLDDYAIKTKLLWLVIVLRTETKWLDLLVLGVLLLAAPLMLIQRGWPRSPHLLLGAAALGVCFLALPSFVFASYYADQRLLPVFFIILFLALGVPAGRVRTLIALLGIALFGARLAATTVGWSQRGAAAERELDALQMVPVGSRIAVFSTTSDCETWALHGRDHLPSLAIVRRDAFVNTQWAIAGTQLMRPIYNEAHGFNESYATRIVSREGRCLGQPLVKALLMLPRDRFDFVWIFDAEPGVPEWLRPVFVGPKGRLYAVEG